MPPASLKHDTNGIPQVIAVRGTELLRNDFSVVDNTCIASENFLSLLVKFIGYLMDLILFFAVHTLHPDTSAHTVHFQLTRAIATFHRPSAEQLLPGKNRFQPVARFLQHFDTTFLTFDNSRH